MKVWLFSTHRAQETDLVRMWLREGINVQGVFDCYSRQRPPVKGVTDPESIPGKRAVVAGGYRKWSGAVESTAEWSDLVELDRELKTESCHFKDVDWYVLMETVDRSQRINHYASMGMRVAMQCFGQETDDADQELVPALLKWPNAHLVCYSPQVADRYIGKKVPRDQVHVIRFGIYPEEWQPAGAWIGDLKLALTAHNSIQYRGEGCGWAEYKGISAGLPFVLIGKDTEQVGGMGEQNFRALKWWYARASCYLSMGTKPAPYTMTPVEAMMSGCPIIMWDNGCGIREEQWAEGLFVTGDIQDVRNYVALILDEKVDVMALSRKSRQVAMDYFNAHTIGKQWLVFFTKYR